MSKIKLVLLYWPVDLWIITRTKQFILIHVIHKQLNFLMIKKENLQRLINSMAIRKSILTVLLQTKNVQQSSIVTNEIRRRSFVDHCWMCKQFQVVCLVTNPGVLKCTRSNSWTGINSRWMHFVLFCIDR